MGSEDTSTQLLSPPVSTHRCTGTILKCRSCCCTVMQQSAISLMRRGTRWRVLPSMDPAVRTRSSCSPAPAAILALLHTCCASGRTTEHKVPGRLVSSLDEKVADMRMVALLPRPLGTWHDDTMPMYVRCGIYVFSVWKPIMLSPTQYYVTTQVLEDNVQDVVTCAECRFRRCRMRSFFDRWMRRVFTPGMQETG